MTTEATRRDYYEVLGVPRDATPAAIKDAFRRLALRYHPDRNKEPGAEARFREIAEAYAVLSDPKKRSEYDARGFAGVAGFTPEDLFGGVDFEDLLGGLDLGAGGLFERFFGCRRRPARGADLEVSLEVSLERVATGGEELVHVTRPVTCSACGGSGAKAGTAPRRCDACGGTGRRVAMQRDTGLVVQTVTTCGACRGRGQIIDQPCSACGARGEVEREETLAVKIPLGAEDGMVLSIPGRGLPSPDPGRAPGDLLVVVRTAPDPRFERQGADLVRTEIIPIADAVLGTTLDVPTLDRHLEVKVPAGTQPDSVLRLKGKGLPEFGGARRGDLYLRLRPRVPDRLTPEERSLYERLRALSTRQARATRSPQAMTS